MYESYAEFLKTLKLFYICTSLLCSFILDSSPLLPCPDFSSGGFSVDDAELLSIEGEPRLGVYVMQNTIASG